MLTKPVHVGRGPHEWNGNGVGLDGDETGTGRDWDGIGVVWGLCIVDCDWLRLRRGLWTGARRAVQATIGRGQWKRGAAAADGGRKPKTLDGAVTWTLVLVGWFGDRAAGSWTENRSLDSLKGHFHNVCNHFVSHFFGRLAPQGRAKTQY